MGTWEPPPNVGHKVGWHIERVQVALKLRYLSLWNRYAWRRVVSRRGTVDVTLTTHGPRTGNVHLAIESIGLGRVRPRRLILWLDEPATVAELPAALARLRSRGLEIRLTENYGPHTKWWPYVSEMGDQRRPMVLADDDTLYPGWWLAGLVRAHRAHPQDVNCWRAHKRTFTAAGIAPYLQWVPCRTTTASYDHFATGVSGVIYGPNMIAMLHREGPNFGETAPRADDVWLHFAMEGFGWKTRQVKSMRRVFPEIPGSRESGLHITNAIGGGNDKQIAATMALFAPMVAGRADQI